MTSIITRAILGAAVVVGTLGAANVARIRTENFLASSCHGTIMAGSVPFWGDKVFCVPPGHAVSPPLGFRLAYSVVRGGQD